MADQHPCNSITENPGVRRLLERALEEDVGSGDATTLALVPETTLTEALILSREPCVVSGTGLAAMVFGLLDATVRAQVEVPDGRRVDAGKTVMRISGPARPILTGERTALNVMQRLCAIATHTAAFVDAVNPFPVQILDTRKTTPGWRALERYAVCCGGGVNHRSGLYDRILIKDNHRRLWKSVGGDDLGEAVREARRRYPELEVEIEVETEAELVSALEGSPDWILLDNMPPDRMRACVLRVAGRCRVEASGGITLANVREAARTGVNAVSLGCLTHSVRSIDLSLELA